MSHWNGLAHDLSLMARAVAVLQQSRDNPKHDRRQAKTWLDGHDGQIVNMLSCAWFGADKPMMTLAAPGWGWCKVLAACKAAWRRALLAQRAARRAASAVRARAWPKVMVACEATWRIALATRRAVWRTALAVLLRAWPKVEAACEAAWRTALVACVVAWRAVLAARGRAGRTAAAVCRAAWRMALATGSNLKELYISYDGRTTLSCAKESVQLQSCIIALSVCAIIYIAQIPLVFYYIHLQSIEDPTQYKSWQNFRMFLYPLVLPALCFYHILKIIYRRAVNNSVCFACRKPFFLIYVDKADILDRRRPTERLQSAHFVHVEVARHRRSKSRVRYGLCLACGTCFAISSVWSRRAVQDGRVSVKSDQVLSDENLLFH